MKHNAALLQELADRTGGRMLLANDPMLIDLFNRDRLEIPKSPKYIWDLLTIIAAALFLLDVAARRLAIDPTWVAALFGRAVRAREDATTQSVSAWKRARAQVSHRQQPMASGAGTQEEIKAGRTTRFDAEEADPRSSYDVGSDTPQDVRKGAMAKPELKRSETDSTEDEDDFTSRLLAARRRAKDEEDQRGQGEGDA